MNKKVVEFKIKKYKTKTVILPPTSLVVTNSSGEELVDINPDRRSNIIREWFEESYPQHSSDIKGINNLIVVDEGQEDLSHLLYGPPSLKSSTGERFSLGGPNQDVYVCKEVESRSDIHDLVKALDRMYPDLICTIYTPLQYSIEEMLTIKLNRFDIMLSR